MIKHFLIWFKELIERIKFKRRKKPFILNYDKRGHLGYAVESYSFLSDKVSVRVSRNGYVSGKSTWLRSEWEELEKQSNSKFT